MTSRAPTIAGQSLYYTALFSSTHTPSNIAHLQLPVHSPPNLLTTHHHSSGPPPHQSKPLTIRISRFRRPCGARDRLLSAREPQLDKASNDLPLWDLTFAFAYRGVRHLPTSSLLRHHISVLPSSTLHLLPATDLYAYA